MPEKNARPWMPDFALAAQFAHERMPAEAGKFNAVRSLGHLVDFVAQNPARIMDRLPEHAGPRLRVRGARQQQRMPAPNADIFVMSIARSSETIMMSAKEAAECVAHARV
jgi:hypothetical protein